MRQDTENKIMQELREADRHHVTGSIERDVILAENRRTAALCLALLELSDAVRCAANPRVTVELFSR